MADTFGLGVSVTKVCLSCCGCRSTDLIIKEFRHANSNTDCQNLYIRLYCPKCGNDTHTIFMASGLDLAKLVKQNKVV